MVEKIAETKKRQYNFSSKHKAKLSAARLLKRTKDDAVKATKAAKKAKDKLAASRKKLLLLKISLISYLVRVKLDM